MNTLYYNLTTDKAFRCDSEHFGKTWYKEVSTHEGRAKQGAERKFMATSELSELLQKGTVVKLYSAKTISRDIAFIKCGKIPPSPETKQRRGKPDANFRFLVGSLIDESPSDYVAICNQFGEIVGHQYNGAEFKHKAQAEELIEEMKNENQLNLFNNQNQFT